MKRKLVRGLGICLSVLPLLFALRLLYGYTLDAAPDATVLGFFDNNNGNGSGNNEGQFGETRKNYASWKMGRVKSEGSAPGQPLQPMQVDQKYEKVASLSATTRGFDEDEAKLRASIKHHQAMIQFEQAHGLAGTRQLRMSIGVPPDRFDAMLAEVHGIGSTAEFQVDKTDKTNEYKTLAAQRASLDKARTALVALKGRGGQIEEQINLENKILEIEEQIQKLGVRLGEFDAENEFVTIRFTLAERAPAVVHTISLRHRAVVALRWSVTTYATLLGLLLLASLSTLFAVLVLEKLKWIPEAVRRIS